MEAAERFFKQAADVVGHVPDRVTTDGLVSYPRAIRETLGSDVLHRTNRYLNNRLEQDHRGIKQRYYPMRGFGSVTSAARFCRAFDEVRQFFRVRTTMKQHVSLAEQRAGFHQRLDALPGYGCDGLTQRRMGARLSITILLISVVSVWNTLRGYEVMNMVRKGQMRGVEKGDILGQVAFIASLFGVAA